MVELLIPISSLKKQQVHIRPLNVFSRPTQRYTQEERHSTVMLYNFTGRHLRIDNILDDSIEHSTPDVESLYYVEKHVMHMLRKCQLKK